MRLLLEMSRWLAFSTNTTFSDYESSKDELSLGSWADCKQNLMHRRVASETKLVLKTTTTIEALVNLTFSGGVNHERRQRVIGRSVGLH